MIIIDGLEMPKTNLMLLVEPDGKVWEMGDLLGDDKLLDGVKAIPAADVRPVVRGKWIQRKNWTRCVCSACSWEITFVTGNSYNYCPNCGAKMEES